MLERTREGTRAGERGRESGETPPPAPCFASVSAGVEAGPTQPRHPPPSPGCKTLQKHWASNLASVFGVEAEAAGEAGLGRDSVPRLLGGLPLCAALCWLPPCSGCSLALLARSAPARGGVRLPGSQGERRHGAHDRWLESFTLLARGCRLLLPRTSPVFSQGGNRRHFAADNEILAANCSRGRCPSGKAGEEGSKRCQEGRDRGRARDGEKTASAEASWSPLTRGRGWKRDGDRGRATGGRSVQIDIFGCLWQKSRRQPLSNVRAERVAACAPLGLLIRIGTWRRMKSGKSKAGMEGCGCVCSAWMRHGT